MPSITVELSIYGVTLGRQLEMLGGTFYAVIVCYGIDSTIFYIYFFRPDSIIPQNSYNPEQKYGTAFLPYDLYPTYIDLLRNEKPVYIFLDSDKPERNQLFTLGEPIGEGE